MEHPILVILDFVKSMAWPVLILILFCYFAEPLKKLLFAFTEIVSERGVKVSTSGIEISGRAQSEPENILEYIKSPSYYPPKEIEGEYRHITDPITEQEGKSVGEILEKHENKMVKDIISQITDLLENHDKCLSREEILKGLLCDAYINLHFEKSLRKIFPSQIKMLKHIKKSNGVTREVAEKFFQKYEDQKKIDFPLWIDFLVKSDFIEEKDGKFYLRDEGKEFLKYIKPKNNRS